MQNSRPTTGVYTLHSHGNILSTLYILTVMLIIQNTINGKFGLVKDLPNVVFNFEVFLFEHGLIKILIKSNFNFTF